VVPLAAYISCLVFNFFGFTFFKIFPISSWLNWSFFSWRFVGSRNMVYLSGNRYLRHLAVDIQLQKYARSPNPSFKRDALRAPLNLTLGAMEAFTVAQYAPDGESLGSSVLAVSQLSPKWLGVCASLIESHGPVFSESMGSTLSHYHVECAAGLCYFKVHGEVLYIGAIIAGSSAVQDSALLQLFAERVHQPPELFAHEERPLFLVVNTFAPDITEEDRHAMFQLAYHVAAAHFIVPDGRLTLHSSGTR
jgi:hypothetical protein